MRSAPLRDVLSLTILDVSEIFCASEKVDAIANTVPDFDQVVFLCVPMPVPEPLLTVKRYIRFFDVDL